MFTGIDIDPSDSEKRRQNAVAKRRQEYLDHIEKMVRLGYPSACGKTPELFRL